MTESKSKRAYSKRRDYKAELGELTMHCKLSIDILSNIVSLPPSDFISGQIAALKAVLARIEKKP